MSNLSNFFIKLKDPKTNWKYILIVVILALFVGGGIILGWQSWWNVEEAKESKVPEIKVSEAKSGNAHEKILIFKKIFPKEIVILLYADTYIECDLNKIAEVDKRAEVYFSGPHYEWDKDCWGEIVQVELDGKPNKELFVFTNFGFWSDKLKIPGEWPSYKDGAFQGYVTFHSEKKEIELPEDWFPNEENRLSYDVLEFANYDELLLEFRKTPRIFPNNEELARENFQPLCDYDKETLTLTIKIPKDDTSLTLFGRLVLIQRSKHFVSLRAWWEEKHLYVFWWGGKGWNLIGNLQYPAFSKLEIGEIQQDNFADIIIFTPARHVKMKIVYVYNGSEYERSKEETIYR